MQTTEDIVRGLSPSQVVEVVKELFDDVYTRFSYDDVEKSAASVTEVAPLVELDEQTLDGELSTEDSARLGRLVLEGYAQDAELSQLVRRACDKVLSSDDLVMGTILALGLVVNLTLLVATTRVHVEKEDDGKVTWSLTKREADKELVKAIVEPVVRAGKAMLG